MRIDRIRLTDFKRHEQLDIRPAAGLTIVRGPNEAGKSTIQTALELGLFRKADSQARDVQAVRRWGADGPPIVELDFEVAGQAGSLVKRFDGGRAEARLTHGANSTTDHAKIEEVITAHTGIPTEGFFRATASVGHAELAEVAGDEPIIQDRLQKAISGADRGTAAAKKKLAAAVHRYKTEGQKNPGLLKVVRAEIEELEGQLVAGEQALSQLESDRARWVDAHERRQGLDVQLERQQADLEEAQRAEGLASRRDESQARYEHLRRAAELVEQEDELRRTIPTDIPLAALRSGVARAASLSLDISEIDAELSVGPDTQLSPEAAERPPKAWRWVAIAAVLAAFAGLVGQLIGDAIGIIIVAVLVALTVAALVQSYRVARRAREYGKDLEIAQRAAEQRVDVDRDRQELLRRKQREYEQQMTQLGVPDVEQAEALLARAETHTAELTRVEGQLSGLGVQERSLRKLEEDRDEAANDAEQAKHALAAMGSVAEDPTGARQQAQRLLQQTQPARDQARTEEDQAQGRIDSNPVDAEEVAALSERLVAARRRQSLFEHRLATYEATLLAIEEAERATLKTAARYLEERMGPAIARISAGRYDEVKVDEADLAFRVRVPETGELMDVTELSQGTSDQLFLTARLGLVRLVTMDRRPPLILDDPFVTFDAERGERALRLVKEVAAEQGFQVIYLTCSDRFDDLADELVVLAGPEAGVPRPSADAGSEAAG